MALTTNVPLPTFGTAGLITASEQAILAGVLQDYAQAFALGGKTLNTALTTPQGQMASSNAYSVAAFQAMLAQLIANVDPLTASGAFQDALGRIYFLTRQAATYATVSAIVYGTVGQTLAAGAQAKSGDGSIWATTADVTFNTSGQAPVTFQALVAGSVPVAGVNDLEIYQQAPGWERITNAAGSVPGEDVENRQNFEARRAASVQIGGVGQAANVRAAVMAVTGVTDCYVYNNGSDAAITYGTTNFPIPAHSIAITVSGSATQAAIAQAINSKLDCGCGMVTAAGLGTLNTYNYQDTVNYGAPYPTYPIKWVTPATTQLYMTVNVANLTTLPANYIVQVQKAVATAFLSGFVSQDGTISVPRARVGAQIVAAEYAAPILALGGLIVPISIFIGTSAAPSSGASITMGIDQQPVCTQLNVTVNAVSV